MSLTDTIKDYFSKKFAAEHKFADHKLADGTIVRTEGEGELKAGDKLSIVSEDGVTPAKEGKYPLEDGRFLIVDADSKISEIIATDKGEEKMADAPVDGEGQPAADAVAPEGPSDQDKITALESKVAELEQSIMALFEQCKNWMDGMESNEEVVAELKKENRSLKKDVKELGAMPAASKTDLKKLEIDSVKEAQVNLHKVKELKYFENKKITPSFIADLREQFGK